MLGDMESAIAFIEKQEAEIISRIKDDWNKSLEEASMLLQCPEKPIVEYNPVIWRVSLSTGIWRDIPLRTYSPLLDWQLHLS